MQHNYSVFPTKSAKIYGKKVRCKEFAVDVSNDSPECLREVAPSMPIEIRKEQVREALFPLLGAEVLDRTDIVAHAEDMLRRFTPFQQHLPDLEKKLKETMFNDLYGYLGARMTLRRGDGQQVRIRVSDLPDLADSAMGVLFDGLPDNVETLQLLREYAMYTTSLSAMRALLQRFGSHQALSEQALLRRIIRDNYPPERYADWLPEA